MGMRWDYLSPLPLSGELHNKQLVEQNWDASLFVTYGADYSLNLEGANLLPHQRVVQLTWPVTDLVGEMSMRIEDGIFMGIATEAAVVVLALPVAAPSALVEALGLVARRSFWMNFVGTDPVRTLSVIRFYCPTQAMYDAMNRYFQGPWELPGIPSAKE